MFQKLVAIEPVSLVPSAEKKLYSFAKEVVMYPDIPATDAGKIPECDLYWHVLFFVFSGKRKRGYSLCEGTGNYGDRHSRLW